MSSLSQFLVSDAPFWVSGTSYPRGKVVRSAVDYQKYTCTVANAGTTDPASTPNYWQPDGARPIKSIQRGLADVGGPVNVTIAAVNPAKTEVRYLGNVLQHGSDVTAHAYVQLSSSTSLGLRRDQYGGNSTLVSWELTEYY